MRENGEEGLSPEAAFALLGEELRLEILFALYEATERREGDRNAVAYSDLQAAVEEADSGRFNYHLTRLTGPFVEKVDGGYAIRQAGEAVVRAVLSGTFTDDPRFGPVPIDETCYRCGGGITVSYGDEHVLTRCLDCDGAISASYTRDGSLSALVYPPAGLHGRSPAEIHELAHLRFEREVWMLAADTCPECGGAADRVLDVCRDHAADDGTLCGRCDLAVGAVGSVRCTVCGFGRITPPLLAHGPNPEVLELLNVDGPGTGAWTRFGAAMTAEFEVVDPERPAVAYPDGEGDRRLRVDADLTLTVV